MPINNAETKVVTGKVRLSYCHVFEPWARDDTDTPKYSVTILIPKSDKSTLSKLKRAREAAIELGKSRFGAAWAKKATFTLHDGDEEADLELNPEYAGHYYMSVSSSTAPGVVDKNVQPILDSTEVYSGCYARVSINAFPYSARGNNGVSFGLNHVQKIADGDFLGGRSRAEDDFDAIDDEEEDEEEDELI